jgi:hypothetical protein
VANANKLNSTVYFFFGVFLGLAKKLAAKPAKKATKSPKKTKAVKPKKTPKKK